MRPPVYRSDGVAGRAESSQHHREEVNQRPAQADEVAEARQLLIRGNLDDLVRAFGLEGGGLARRIVEGLARPAAAWFARDLEAIDRVIGSHGLAAAGRRITSTYTHNLRITGLERVPRTGPLLVVSNHPGTVDAGALWVALASRGDDLRILAADREVLRAMPNLQRKLFAIADGAGASTLRRSAGWLREGNALLTFPAGTIEPDPTIRPAVAALDAWSRSTDLFVRLAPETVVLPVAVRGVISPTALRHPLARRLPQQTDREWTAACLQVLVRHYRDTRTRVAVGEPFLGRSVASADAAAREQLTRLLG